jgi:hypothetical protein
LWNDLININIEDSITSHVKDYNNLKNEIKEGIKQGVKEALNEVLDDLETNNTSNLLKDLALYSSGLFFIYFTWIFN